MAVRKHVSICALSMYLCASCLVPFIFLGGFHCLEYLFCFVVSVPFFLPAYMLAPPDFRVWKPLQILCRVIFMHAQYPQATEKKCAAHAKGMSAPWLLPPTGLAPSLGNAYIVLVTAVVAPYVGSVVFPAALIV